MRMVYVPKLGRDVSAIGLGCASLGSRISARDGQRAIDHALDLGLSWFDVAPPYGDGRAEALLGHALRGRRDKVVICTKFGIGPPQVSLAAKLIRPAARHAVALVPALRRVAAKSRSTGTRAPIDPAAIEASVTRSLRLLGTDYIDVLAVHQPTPADAANDGIFEVLRHLVVQGRVRAVSIVGEPDSIVAAARAGQPIDIAQFVDTPLTDAVALLRKQLASPLTFVTQGVFGSGIAEAMANMHGWQRDRIAALAKRNGIDIAASPNDLLLRFAFSNNPDGVVIVSMFNPRHIERNIAAAATAPTTSFAADLREALAATPDHPRAA